MAFRFSEIRDLLRTNSNVATIASSTDTAALHLQVLHGTSHSG
jgi:hypothetical protein